MNTDVGIWLWNPSRQVDRLMQHAMQRFEEAEAELSRFRPDSGLSRLNAAAGLGPQTVSPLLWTALNRAVEAARQTLGLFDPTVLDLLRAAGYDRSFELLDSSSDTLGPSAKPSCGWHQIRFYDSVGQVELPAGVGIDLGGIAKGWTVDRVAVSLATHGPVLVDAGGDIRAVGMPGGEPWPVAVQDPFDETRDCAVLALNGGAVATSSIGRRRWQRNGQTMHHLIDPRTGQPSDSDLHTVTVLADTAEEAEVSAKTVLMLGTQAGASWLKRRDLRGLLIDRRGREHSVGTLPIYTMLEIA
ncbi:MAG: FAD:protein FMN transferase [Anaerolineales bacterium]|nr:FAD:protein FMN transferase [Anaerolineae bacterium]MCB9131090.1 FAD:protein FMN transferase [Anaerolineales bacterium]MCB9141380.1 FAD:protein FMN transferase [Anaerolineales bacterium]